MAFHRRRTGRATTAQIPTTPSRIPWALASALLASAVLAAWIQHAEPRFVDASGVLVYRTKLQRAERGPDADIVLLGDSVALSAFQPRLLARELPPGVRLYNFALPGAGPTGGEALLRRYLKRHPPPHLVVLGYTPLILDTALPAFFSGSVVRYVLGGGDVLRLAWRERDARPVLQWLATRIPTLRHRDDLGSALRAALFDRVPILRSLWYEIEGAGRQAGDDFRFLWFNSRRVERNAGVLRALRENQGYRYIRERAVPGEKLPDNTRFFERPFRPEPREERSRDALVALCREHGIAVLIVAVPQPSGQLRAAERAGGAEAKRAFWSGAAAADPRVWVTEEIVLDYPHRLFSDRYHLNPKGAETYSRWLAPRLADAWSRASR